VKWLSAWQCWPARRLTGISAAAYFGGVLFGGINVAVVYLAAYY